MKGAITQTKVCPFFEGIAAYGIKDTAWLLITKDKKQSAVAVDEVQWRPWPTSLAAKCTTNEQTRRTIIPKDIPP